MLETPSIPISFKNRCVLCGVYYTCGVTIIHVDSIHGSKINFRVRCAVTSLEKPNHFIKVNLIVVVYCSSIKHSTRHITTWESMYNTIDGNKKTQKIKVFNQVDYIICRAAQTSILQKARSCAGTEMSNDHRLLVTKMRIERFYLYKKNKVKFDALIDLIDCKEKR